VQSLKPFSPSEKTFILSGEISSKGAELIVEFQLEDPNKLFELPGSFLHGERALPKQDGLWLDTCFEVFLSPTGSSRYYEFNFSLIPAWNVYVFEAYREPQPPHRTEDFILREMRWDKPTNHLVAKLENAKPQQIFEASLTAVLKEKNGNKHYCALTHVGPKADFHRRESFTLLRGEKQ